MNRTLTGVAYATPLLVVLAALLFYPLLLMATRSLGAEAGFSLSVYSEIVTNSRYLRSFAFTALLAGTSTLLALLICVPAALYIEGGKTRARRVAAILLAVPLSLPGIVIGFFVILGFGRTGVVTDFVEEITPLRNPQLAYTFWGLLLGYVYFQVPRVLLVLRGAVSGLSQDALESARSLGAGPWRVLWEVVLPSLRPALVNATSLSLATAFGAFGTAATLSRGTRVVPLEIAALFTERFQPERAAALSIILALVTITLLLGVGRFETSKR